MAPRHPSRYPKITRMIRGEGETEEEQGDSETKLAAADVVYVT